MDFAPLPTPGRRMALLGAAAFALPRGAAAQAARLTLGGGPDGEAAQLIGAAIAGIVTRGAPGLEVVARATETYAQNTRMLGAGELGMGLLQVDLAMNAYEGDGPFRGRPMPGLRALAVVYGSHMHVVTLADRGISSLRDLKGKRVGVNRAGSATEMMASRLMVAAGVNRNADLLGLVNAPLAEMLAALGSGQLDALFYSSGIPTGPIAAFGARPDISMALVEHGALADRVIARHGPVYAPDLIPAGTYPDQVTPYSHISAPVVLAATDALPPAQATAMLNAIWDKRADVAQAHPDGRKFTLDQQRNASAGIPWHPAAEAFWRTKGAVLA